MRRIAWTQEAHAQHGRAGGFHLFSIHWGMTRQDAMWDLTTRLPISHSLLGQVHATPDAAKEAAEKLLAAFIRKIDTEATP